MGIRDTKKPTFLWDRESLECFDLANMFRYFLLHAMIRTTDHFVAYFALLF
jgi:hypothetical protein